MKKLISLLLVTLFTTLTNTAFAQESSQSSLTDKIKEKLEDTAEQGLDNLKQAISEKSQLPQKKAYLGNIKSIDNQTIILDYKAQSLTITVDDSTQYSKTGLEKLNIDDFIIAMGFVSPDSSTLAAKKISYIQNLSNPDKRQIIKGTISEIDNNTVTVDNKTLIIGKNTELKIPGVDKPTIEDLQLDDNLFSIVTLDKNGDIDKIEVILVVPGKNSTAALEPTNADATQSAATEAE